MIRPFTCICMLLAGISGLWLYHVKHRAQVLDREIEHVLHQASATRDRTSMLRAEWALLNDPQRLQQLASQYLQLRPMAPSQFVQMSDLDQRLPPVAPPAAVAAADSEPETDAPAAAVTASTDAMPAPQTSARASPPADAPVAVADAKAPPAPPAPPLIARASAAPRHDSAGAADRRDAAAPDRRDAPADRKPRPAVAVAAVRPPPRPVVPPVVSAFATQDVLPAAHARARIERVEAIAPAPYAPPAAGSALGAANPVRLPPPVPLPFNGPGG